jgi:hypothetical protein
VSSKTKVLITAFEPKNGKMYGDMEMAGNEEIVDYIKVLISDLAWPRLESQSPHRMLSAEPRLLGN